MHNSPNEFLLGYCNQQVKLINHCSSIQSTLEKVFRGLLLSSDVDTDTEFEIYQDLGTYKLDRNGINIFLNEQAIDVIGFAINAIKFSLIHDLNNCLVLHSALLTTDCEQILLTAPSGSGKSVLSAFLVSLGYRYHSDELVAFHQQKLKPYRRELMLKQKGIDALFNYLNINTKLDAASHATSIPMELLSCQFLAEEELTPQLTHVIFPAYDANHRASVVELSRAQAATEMMRSNVLARNVPDMGLEDMADLLKTARCYQLSYSHFDQLSTLLNECNLSISG